MSAERALSKAGFILMAGGVGGLLLLRSLFSPNPLAIAVQAASFALMVWARVTFGSRSFHAAADPTEGGLVTTGPYALVRHPIYAAVCFFVAAGMLANLSLPSAALALAVFVGAGVRMRLEERLLVLRYPEYAAYAARVKRVIPHVL